MARYLEGKVVLVIGTGSEAHRGVAVALTEAGARVAVGGPAGDLAAEAALHSISNELWAMGGRSTVVTLPENDPAAFAAAVNRAGAELGPVSLIVRCDPVLNA